MPVTYKGLDCLADMSAEEYTHYYTQSQTEIPWASQAYYGYYTIYFGSAVVGVALFKNLYYRSRDHFYSKSQSAGIFTPLVDTLVAYSRFLGYKQTPMKLTYFTSLPPSVGSSLFLMASSLYLFLYCFVPHFWYRGCRGFGSPPLAVRAGVMATALTPFIYILAGKSNFITLVTGISYEKLNYLHQYVGVAALVLSLVHTIPFIYQAIVEGGAANLRHTWNNEAIYRNGVPPLVLLILLCSLSKAGVRKWFYEGFLHLHWMMGIAYFGTLGYHIYGSMATENYMWAALAFWFTQVFYRLFVKTCLKPNALFLRPSEAKLFKLQGSNAYQVNVKNRGIFWKPGQHVYLRFASRVLDNHPFSVCNLPKESENELKFIIIPKRGLTKSLYDKIDSCLSEKVYIDGPYGGCSRNHHTFEKVYLIASGSGVTATMSFLTDLAQKIESGENKVTKEVTFVWVVRKLEDIDWFRTELNKALECDRVNVLIYVCDRSSQKEKYLNEKETFTSESLEAAIETRSNELNVKFGRPNMENLVKSFAPSLGRRNFVCSSGSDSMKFQVSSGVSALQPLIFNKDLYASEVEEIFLHTESFGW
ncbi:Ferric reductase [Yamadazyma tenuis]|uniref:ferric-chelate reductase (NADPH) n=1 Tax=Candida tenuis (strain ATCC 10573 / BCRC 21748 / CBS 615 / JCM 9827 / NBRC 10315 / NRRL Y-1498 / VKM Y-70) TaxID=590646 RepID=G3BBM3_CANTC|nr:uncharacterized protein CANTEDRAFT_94462 [Yamadazyma tenuis ATCC 10573]EGV61574.1 hypothetical protein CANTEDRAFT_94462 [Yamadazyma tenuis ATCC 10573]WEJ92795.1 Ferric reductase [Yamadazyma tenuis]